MTIFNEMYKEMYRLSGLSEEESEQFDEFDSFSFLVSGMTHYEMIEFVTDMYVSKLTPLNYELIEMQDLPCDKRVSFERYYDYS